MGKLRKKIHKDLESSLVEFKANLSSLASVGLWAELMTYLVISILFTTWSMKYFKVCFPSGVLLQFYPWIIEFYLHCDWITYLNDIHSSKFVNIYLWSNMHVISFPLEYSLLYMFVQLNICMLFQYLLNLSNYFLC